MSVEGQEERALNMQASIGDHDDQVLNTQAPNGETVRAEEGQPSDPNGGEAASRPQVKRALIHSYDGWETPLGNEPAVEFAPVISNSAPAPSVNASPMTVHVAHDDVEQGYDPDVEGSEFYDRELLETETKRVSRYVNTTPPIKGRFAVRLIVVAVLAVAVILFFSTCTGGWFDDHKPRPDAGTASEVV